MIIDDFNTPGQFIEALIEERGWTQRLLAAMLGVSGTILNRLITNKLSVTAEMAIALGEIFEFEPVALLNLQNKYNLAKARISIRPDPDRATRAALFGGLPVAEMIKRGWINAADVRDFPKVEKALAIFFGVESINEIEILPHANKKTDTFTPATPVQLAWIYRVKQIASEMLAARYSPAAGRNSVNRLNELLSAQEEVRKVPRILTESGIRFVVVESLSSAKIDGVCFWLNDQSPVIGMSLRYDRIDNFWFVLRHELEHVLQRHGQNNIYMLDAELEGENAGTGDNIAQEERIANEAAAEFCVPQEKIDSFIARKAPFFRERDIIGISRILQIHPGLIAGQLQYRTGRYDLFRKFLVKIRSHVSPGAMTDGWGDVYPVGL
ncbi:MAG: HigA family addiction module antitoxin [Methanoregula sp.]